MGRNRNDLRRMCCPGVDRVEVYPVDSPHEDRAGNVISHSETAIAWVTLLERMR